MRGALILLLLVGPAPSAPTKGRPADVPVERPLAPPVSSHAGTGETKCGACHVTAAWSDVRFNHDRTGFPLTGAHRATPCKGCHESRFDKPLPTSCAGCHLDVHAGQLGARCEGCHDGVSWLSRFDADAHRKTGFPLVGGHATLPCDECHGQAGGRGFARPVVDCAGCHQGELAGLSNTVLDHSRLGFSGSCRGCHNAWRFRPARYPQHDACFVVSSGGHAALDCLSCHTSLAPAAAPGTCSTRTATCLGCHACSPAGTQPIDRIHQGVGGYQCVEQKCAGCHQTVQVR